VDFVEEKLVFNPGSGTIPAPRKRDSIAKETELILTNFDLGNTGGGGGIASGGASD